VVARLTPNRFLHPPPAVTSPFVFPLPFVFSAEVHLFSLRQWGPQRLFLSHVPLALPSGLSFFPTACSGHRCLVPGASRSASFPPGPPLAFREIFFPKTPDPPPNPHSLDILPLCSELATWFHGFCLHLLPARPPAWRADPILTHFFSSLATSLSRTSIFHVNLVNSCRNIRPTLRGRVDIPCGDMYQYHTVHFSPPPLALVPWVGLLPPLRGLPMGRFPSPIGEFFREWAVPGAFPMIRLPPPPKSFSVSIFCPTGFLRSNGTISADVRARLAVLVPPGS